MRKAFLAPMIAVAAALVGIAFWARKPPANVTLQFQSAKPTAGGVSLTFQINNRTRRLYSFHPLRLENWDGHCWMAVPEGIWAASEPDDNPDASCNQKLICFTKRLPPGRLRLVAQSVKAQCGLASYPTRVRLRMSNWQASASLNPFDTNTVFGAEQGEVISEEFRGP